MDSTFNTPLTDHIIKALCNTLMYSLWQGILLAVAGGAIIIFTKKSSAAYRYNLLITAMVLFFCGALFTFGWQLQEPQRNTETYIGYAAVANVAISSPVKGVKAAIAPGIQKNAKESAAETVISYFNTHYSFIVLIWFLVICAKSIQMAVGLQSVFHLKHTSVFSVDKYWAAKVLQLAEQLNVKPAISLLESGIAKVPMVIGHLKPVILIPIGLISALSAEEVEAILVHELAHIRRRDYLVNLLQSFMEIVFFFNPAALWISQLIKTERENCCDDLALQQSSDKISYIQALVSCEEYRSVIPAHVMAFPGSKNTLLGRVKRMAGNRNHSLNLFEKTVLAVCLVLSGLCISAFTARENINKALKSAEAVIRHNVRVNHKEQGEAVKEDTNVQKQEAPINGSAALLNQSRQPALSTTDTGRQADSSPLKTLTQAIDSLRYSDGAGKSLLATLAKLDTINFKKSHAIGLELYRERLVTDTNHLNISLNERELIVNGVRMPENVHARIYRQFDRKEGRGSYSGGYTGSYYPSDGPEHSRVTIPDFGDTLVKYGIVKDKRFMHVIFNKRGLIINGVKQPDDIFETLLKKYGNNVSITYTNNGLPDKRMEQHGYWVGQERKIVDQMQREGLISNRKELSFTLTDKTFVINGLAQNAEVFQRYRQEYLPADAGDNWTWNYPGRPGYFSAYANSYRNTATDYQPQAQERRRLQTEIDKKLVADLMQDGLITDAKNVSFSLTDKNLTVNGKKQSDDTYQKYKDKYKPDNTGTNWSWSFSHHE